MSNELKARKAHPWLIFAMGVKHSERLESQINFFACLMVIFAGFVSLCINSYLSLYLDLDTLIATASSIFLIVIGAVFYVIGLKMKRPENSGALLVSLAATLIMINWLSNQGGQGSLGLWFSPLFIITAGMLRGWLLTTVASYLAITIGVSIWLELKYSQLVTVYASLQAQVFDIGTVILLTALISFLSSLFMVYAYRQERIRALELAIEQTRNETRLDAAKFESDQLRSLLPICAWCKKIQTSNGTWSDFERYLIEHQKTEVTHGMCPSCYTEAEEKEFD
jgi:hypothetical protein